MANDTTKRKATIADYMDGEKWEIKAARLKEVRSWKNKDNDQQYSATLGFNEGTKELRITAKEAMAMEQYEGQYVAIGGELIISTHPQFGTQVRQAVEFCDPIELNFG